MHYFIFRQIALSRKGKVFHCPVTTKKKKVIFAFVEGNRGQASHEKKIHGGPKSHKPKSKSLSAAETEVFPQKKSSRDFERKIMTFSSLSLLSTFLAVVLTTTKNDLDFAGKWVLLLTLFFSLARQQKKATQLPKKEFQKIGLKIGLYCGVGTPP